MGIQLVLFICLPPGLGLWGLQGGDLGMLDARTWACPGKDGGDDVTIQRFGRHLTACVYGLQTKYALHKHACKLTRHIQASAQSRMHNAHVHIAHVHIHTGTVHLPTYLPPCMRIHAIHTDKQTADRLANRQAHTHTPRLQKPEAHDMI